jgi:hypothetical protein
MPNRKIPFSIFQKNRDQQLVVASPGSEVLFLERHHQYLTTVQLWAQTNIPINAYEQK